ncbi:hypothetical protein ACLOJK_007719 [Asimina triloba]
MGMNDVLKEVHIAHTEHSSFLGYTPYERQSSLRGRQDVISGCEAMRLIELRRPSLRGDVLNIVCFGLIAIFFKRRAGGGVSCGGSDKVEVRVMELDPSQWPRSQYQKGVVEVQLESAGVGYKGIPQRRSVVD